MSLRDKASSMKNKVSPSSKGELFNKLKSKLKNVVIMALVYLLISIGYSNLTWDSLRAKLTFLNRMFYSPMLSVRDYMERKKKKEAEELELANTKALKIKLVTKTPSISLSGIIEPLEQVEVYSKVSGRIERFFVTEGEKIEENQKLAKIDNLSLILETRRQQAALAAANAQLRLAREKYGYAKRNLDVRLNEADKRTLSYEKTKEDYVRAEEIYDKKKELLEAEAISEEELEAAKADFIAKESFFNIAKRDKQIAMVGLKNKDIEKAGVEIPEDKEEKIEVLRNINTRVERSEVNVAEKNRRQSAVQLQSTRVMLKESTLYSPIEGVVARINKSVGELLDSGGTSNTKSIMTLVYIKEVYAAFFINEEDTKIVKEELAVNVKTDIYPDRIFEGKVEIVSPIIDPKTHTTQIKVLLDNEDLTLKPGMFVRLEIITGEPEKVVVIPYSAVQPAEENEGFVFLIKDKIIYKTKVKLGKKEDDNIVILEGLKETDIIAIANLNKLRDGMQVNPKFE